ncbi:hypothetical protein HOA55_02995 [archaeon]|jgi:hypothetical protein|nr:hypothetical protein [archaeon]MBT3577460.1 hypothetical protein [archaeon]MBT6820297.1 hypothetical protein [archaeon]MBT6955994.1 hypothetical protein [archaeon]MBT7025111.1 hypothetical protein [archaeon]
METTRRNFLKSLAVIPLVGLGCESREDRYSELDKKIVKVVNESRVSREHSLEVMVGKKKVSVKLHGGAVGDRRMDYRVEDTYVEMRTGSETPNIYQIIDESQLKASPNSMYRDSDALRGVRNDPEAVSNAKEFGKKVADAVDSYQQAAIKKSAKKARETLSSDKE